VKDEEEVEQNISVQTSERKEEERSKEGSEHSRPAN